MKMARKPVLVNLSIVAAILLLNYITTTANQHDLFGRFAVSGLAIVFLAGVNLVIGMVRNRDRKGDGPVYLLMAGILLLIGFSVCTA
jgi:hypothetical protein